MAVVEPQDLTQRALLQYNLPSPAGLIRLMIQQSNCFIVLERGAAIGAGLRFKQAQTSMMVSDTRSGVQVAAASGSVEKADFAIGGLVGSGGGGLGLGAYENTAEGKVVAASFLDNWNQVVRTVRANPMLHRQTTTLEKEAGTVTQAAAPAAAALPSPPPPPMQRGDVLVPKIVGITVHATPSEKGRLLLTLVRNDEVVFMGNEQDGFLNVRTSKGAGWVDKAMMRKN